MSFILLYWRQGLLVALIAVYSGWLYRIGGNTPRSELAAYKASVMAQSAKAEADNKGIEAQQERNRKNAQETLAKLTKDAADNAVTNYRARYPVRVCQSLDRGVTLPRIASGVPANDAGTAKQVAPDPDAFVKSCGADAALVITWQQWATDNHIPVQ